MWTLRVDHYFHPPSDPGVIGAIHELKDLIMATKEQTAADLDAIISQVGKIDTETLSLIDKVNELTAALDQLNDTPPEITAKIEALKAQVAIVDNRVPDAPPAGGGDEEAPAP